MRVVFAGTPEPAVPSLRALLESERHEVIAVVTRPDAAAGRGRKTMRSPVGQLADEHGIPVFTPAKPADPDFVSQLTELAPDVCPVVAYGALLPQPVLDIPRFGWINLHFSLLPAWRGAAPVQAAIAAGDEITGASTFLLDAGMDTGPVLGVVTERVRATDTTGDLLTRLASSGADLLAATLDAIEDGTASAHPQPEDGISYASKVSVDAARIDWTRSAAFVDRHIRSVTPAPGAWTTIGELRVKISPVQHSEDTLAPGSIEVRKSGVHIGTGTTAVVLGEVQPQGKKLMKALDWARGARLDDTAVAR
ncbi:MULTISPECIES: methionyl-tRNA formyltransferase [unclassified Rhodococcus (in: high G+C Gram-positive bacteria)]|uniref:methionyl-tRNA formyltransferase n=1 Tax=unclassified Rhodococcus (in: high G+C Gram-positive bacteria) TaxID=192944 RepID=UPI000B9BFAEB|nr:MULTISPECIES: methionyl-tRNA formyltransferase [unclassified Rhodococcus (in: high G+C Gram-positive bacteria)]OZE25960.1 methionyl-tRNA formyltransferase [Rhodococcus sp. 05-2254-6]OZE31470.1 methionyl-tRNA formyltransferase [Rhodococcus sp. 05-2254-4]OZE41620.1 methionyl-tRNA formyltransferase [Rhodococcus sp. 05-2254-3]OZE52054.1 methionyl-tRNA formyltransferase [Rhodococcus sp. 05-2254-2]OZF43281.1 methionyl-tRNA formyltransferase [Rhodococcus sp. 14-1411-2a]